MIRRFWRALRRRVADPVTPVAPAVETETAKADKPGINVYNVNVPPPPRPVEEIFQLPTPPKGVLPANKTSGGEVIAMDWSSDVASVWAWAMQGAFNEGIGFLGYPYLAQLTQRPEYRRISEIIAKEMSRKWIKVTATGKNKADKVKAMEDAMARFGVQELFRKAAEVDGFFGRSQIFVDTGHADNPDELRTPLIVDKRKIGKGDVKGFKVIEPLWTYPGVYNSDRPLRSDFYKPSMWYVQGDLVHSSRLLTLVMRELPDILKPAYQFGGLSMSQMAKPYVDNWLRTRQSVSDLLHSFSTMVLSTDLSTILQDGGAADQLIARATLFTQTRDNRGLMMTNKETEELTNVSTPLGTLDHLQAQSQEQMATPAGIPLVVLFGITPSGLNASSDGEIRTFYASISSDQERFFRPMLQVVFELIQLNEFGEIDPGLAFTFNPLWETPQTEIETNRKITAETDNIYINAGVVDPEEVRERLAGDDESPYHGLDLTKTVEAPAVALAEAAAQEPDPDDEDDDDAPPAQDAGFEESKHPRAGNGEFGAGGGGASEENGASKLQKLMAQVRAATAAREELAAALAAPGRPIRMRKGDGRTAMAGPDVSKPGGFRVTRFDADGEPNGHVEYPDLETAINEALREGYEPAARRG